MLKEIWLEFCNSLKDKWIESYIKYKNNSKQSFQFLKEGIISFVTGIYKWLYNFIVDNGITTINLIVFTLVSFGKMILNIIKTWYDTTISWIIKW